MSSFSWLLFLYVVVFSGLHRKSGCVQISNRSLGYMSCLCGLNIRFDFRDEAICCSGFSGQSMGMSDITQKNEVLDLRQVWDSRTFCRRELVWCDRAPNLHLKMYS